MKPYDKSDDFNFPIVNFPFICSKITAASAYGVYISQLIRYSRACGSYRWLLLTRKLLNQGFLLVKLKSSLRKFYIHHHDQVNRYGTSVSQMTTIYSTWRKHVSVLSSYMAFHQVCNQSNTTGATSVVGTAHPSGAPEFTTVFSWVRVTQCLVLSVIFCRSLFVLQSFIFLLVIVLSVILRFTDSDYHSGIFKLFSKLLPFIYICALPFKTKFLLQICFKANNNTNVYSSFNININKDDFLRLPRAMISYIQHYCPDRVHDITEPVHHILLLKKK